MVFIDDGESDNGCFLFLEWQIRYGTGRADLTAQVAVVFAVPKPRDDHRRKEAIEACLERGRIERISGANLHTFPTAHALLQKLIISVNTGGAVEVWTRPTEA